MYYHAAANSKALNQAGQYYAAHNHSREGFAAKTAPAQKWELGVKGRLVGC